MKAAGRKLEFLSLQRAIYFLIPLYAVGVYLVYNKHLIPDSVEIYLPYVFSMIALITLLKSFTERIHARVSWMLVVMNHFWVALAISFNETFSFDQVHFYLSGIFISGLLGYVILRWLKSHEGSIDLDQFHGHTYRHPKYSILFLLACLGVSGFPITPAFIGEDLIFTHIHENQPWLAMMVSLAFVIDGLAIIRIYARIFMGPHVKSIYDMAYRSS
jgi:hypothetical protein